VILIRSLNRVEASGHLFNKRSMKVYVDDQRVLNIPNLEEEVGSFQFILD
jgi:hypothetical protein